MRTSKKGADFIKGFEGCKLKAYLCPAGIPTIGYGNTFYEDGRKVTLRDEIHQEMADELFLNLLPKYEHIVNSKIKVMLNQNQFDALVSHTYNTGGSNTLFELINRQVDVSNIKYWFENKYTTANGALCPGLVKRRKAESKLYFTK